VADGDGVRPRTTADKTLGDIVNDVSDKAVLLVREEIELAKAELQVKLSRLVRAIVAGVVAGVLLALALIYVLHGLAYLLGQVAFSNNVYLGYFVVTGALLLIAIVGALLAVRWAKRGVPPTPELALEEAKRTRAMIEEARR
jgi:uncharacterized membrane protein YqjE